MTYDALLLLIAALTPAKNDYRVKFYRFGRNQGVRSSARR